MKKLFLTLMLSGCATMNIQSGEHSKTDTYCGKVDVIDVYTRVGVQTWPAILTCKEALKAVDEAYTAMWMKAAPLNTEWAVIYTMGAPGYSMEWTPDPGPLYGGGSPGSSLRPVETIATTYPATHVMEVKATKPWATYHEMFHAYEFDYGRSNGHRGWCKNYGLCHMRDDL